MGIKQNLDMMDYRRITWPVFVIHAEPEVIDGIVWIEDQVVDDTNMLGETLGERRLQTPMKSIYPLRYMIEDEIAMNKHRGKLFIDSLDVDEVIAQLLVTEGFSTIEEVAFVPMLPGVSNGEV